MRGRVRTRRSASQTGKVSATATRRGKGSAGRVPLARGLCATPSTQRRRGLHVPPRLVSMQRSRGQNHFPNASSRVKGASRQRSLRCRRCCSGRGSQDDCLARSPEAAPRSLPTPTGNGANKERIRKTIHLPSCVKRSSVGRLSTFYTAPRNRSSVGRGWSCGQNTQSQPECHRRRGPAPRGARWGLLVLTAGPVLDL